MVFPLIRRTKTLNEDDGLLKCTLGVTEIDKLNLLTIWFATYDLRGIM